MIGIFGFIAIQQKPLDEFSTNNCSSYKNDGSCVIDNITFFDSQINSIIDANNVLVESNPEQAVTFGSEKMVLVTKSILIDSNQKIVSNSTQNIGFNPATLLDLNKNILDLGSVQLVFDIYYKKNANVIINGDIEVYLNEELRGKRLLSYSGQLPANHVRLNVDKESKLLSERTQSFTFTLADEGKNWADGSVNTLKIVLKNLKSQVIANGEIQEFDYGKDIVVYNLEMTVDQAKQVSFDENNNAISIFKNDGVFQSCVTIKEKWHGWASLSPLPTPKIKLYDDKGMLLTEIPSIIQPQCLSYNTIPRNSVIKILVDGLEYEYHTPNTKTELLLECYGKNGRLGGRNLDYDSVCTSNFGYESSVLTAVDCSGCA